MRHWLPRLLIIASLGLHVITVASYVRQPDMMAAFTIYPIWMWSIVGLLLAAAAFLFWRAQLSLLLIVLWLFIALTQSDESHALFNLGNEIPEPRQPKSDKDQVDQTNSPTIRICTLNCGYQDFKNASKDQEKWKKLEKQAEIIAAYQPDILFMQEIADWHAEYIRKIVFGDEGGDLKVISNSATMTRGKLNKSFKPRKIMSNDEWIESLNQHSTIELDGQLIECINFQITSAITDMRLWKASCWKKHAANRKKQRSEVSWSLAILNGILKDNSSFPDRPVIAAGDFNAPASDPLHDLLRVNFIDSFGEVGSGWANTWHRRIPFQRIDYIYTSPQLTPVRSRNVDVPASDHLMVVSDFILKR